MCYGVIASEVESLAAVGRRKGGTVPVRSRVTAERKTLLLTDSGKDAQCVSRGGVAYSSSFHTRCREGHSNKVNVLRCHSLRGGVAYCSGPPQEVCGTCYVAG